MSIVLFLSLGIFILISWQSFIYAYSLVHEGLKSSVLFIPWYPFAYIAAIGATMVSIVLLYDLIESVLKVITSYCRGRLWAILIIIFVLVIFTIPLCLEYFNVQFSPYLLGALVMIIALIFIFSGMSYLSYTLVSKVPRYEKKYSMMQKMLLAD